MKFLGLVASAAAAANLTYGTCQIDSDCLSFTLRLHSLPSGSRVLSDAGYACVQGTCTYVVSPGMFYIIK
jgi:hypothetical protein